MFVQVCIHSTTGKKAKGDVNPQATLAATVKAVLQGPYGKDIKTPCLVTNTRDSAQSLTEGIRGATQTGPFIRISSLSNFCALTSINAVSKVFSKHPRPTAHALRNPYLWQGSHRFPSDEFYTRHTENFHMKSGQNACIGALIINVQESCNDSNW